MTEFIENTEETEIKEVIVNKSISAELKKSYIEYAMSVIIGRSIPDIRDGLKPVQRRILYSMHVNGFTSSSPTRKCATIVGHVLGHYHPHGDSSVYFALVRMAQEFSLRYMLVQGQGNFGSIDGDDPAAYRYTEARLQKISSDMLADINENTVDYIDNYDGSEQEPCFLPARVPNALLNGSTGIAVGMATNMAPHNLTEVCNAIIHAINIGVENLNVAEIMKYIKGPDFPTGGIILGQAGIVDAIRTGRGRIVMRGRAEIVVDGWGKGKDAIIITEIPYGIKKRSLIKKIAKKVKSDQLPEIHDIRDESDKDGLRIFIELKKGSDSMACLNRLYKESSLQKSFHIQNLILINKGRQPKILNYTEILQMFIAHREDVIRRRTEFRLKKAQLRIEVVLGLIIAINNIDKVVQIIKSSKNTEEAGINLQTEFKFTELQTDKILKMPLGRLTSLQTQKLKDEEKELKKAIQRFQEILRDKDERLKIIKLETQEIIDKYGDARRSEIIEDDGEISEISLKTTIPVDICAILLTKNQIIKRMTMQTFQSQNRGGKGKIGAKIREDDQIHEMFVTSSHDTLLLFTSQGRIYTIPAYQIPMSTRTSQGKSIKNFIQLQADEKIVDLTHIDSFDNKEDISIVFVTEKGMIKKTALDEYSNIRKTGIISIKIKDGDSLICAKLCEKGNHILVASKKGYAIHFEDNELRPLGRSAMGVKAMSLRENDTVADLIVANEDVEIITLTKNGYGKRSRLGMYRKTHRAGKGVINIKLRDESDVVIAVKAIKERMNLVMASDEGVLIRISTDTIRSTGRAAKGVIVMRLNEGDRVSGVALAEVYEDDDDDDDDDDDGNIAVDAAVSDSGVIDSDSNTDVPDEEKDSEVSKDAPDEEIDYDDVIAGELDDEDDDDDEI